MIRGMRRLRIAWLVAISLMSVGSLGAHSVAYRLAEPDAGARADALAGTGHGYFAYAPFLVASALAVGRRGAGCRGSPRRARHTDHPAADLAARAPPSPRLRAPGAPRTSCLRQRCGPSPGRAGVPRRAGAPGSLRPPGAPRRPRADARRSLTRPRPHARAARAQAPSVFVGDTHRPNPHAPPAGRRPRPSSSRTAAAPRPVAARCGGPQPANQEEHA